MPTPFTDTALTVDGEIVPAGGLANRRYVWVPSLSAIVGGVCCCSPASMS